MSAAAGGATRRVTFVNRRGQTLVGVLHGEPDGRAVISCHGMLSNKDSGKHELLARELGKRGVATLRFDFAGRGESAGSLFELSYSNEVQDLDAAIELLCARGVTRLGLFGSSMGGTVALLTAAHDERVVAVATLAAVGHTDALDERNPREVALWKSQGYVEGPEGRVGAGFYDDAMAHDIIAAVRILRAPVLVVHGAEDEVVPTSDAHDIATAARDVSLHIVDGADHRFSNPVHLRPAMQRVADFLAERV